MDTQKQKPEIDPLRRVFVPRERMTSNGTIVFKTTDNLMYARQEEGAPMYRVDRKVRGKKARALDKQRRRELRKASA